MKRVHPEDELDGINGLISMYIAKVLRRLCFAGIFTVENTGLLVIRQGCVLETAIDDIRSRLIHP